MKKENKKELVSPEEQDCNFKVIFEFTGRSKPERAVISIPEGLTKPRQRSFNLDDVVSREECLCEIMADVHLIFREAFQWDEDELSEFEENYGW